MLVFATANIAVFATPKTGSTALYMALRKHAQIVLAGQPRFKHMTVRKYERHFEPFLEGAYGLKPERVAAMREPLEYLRSWYKYRQRPELTRASQSTENVSFEEFALAAIASDPPAYAAVGPQLEFLSNATGEVGIHHLFSHEDGLMTAFISERLGKDVRTKPHNVSPIVPTDLSAEADQRIRTALAADYAIWDRIRAAGGYLPTGYGT
ncbi:MAG TPA: hypothetical protein DEF12_05535 [Rhodobacteraceae bacterium]|jgi:hypothetical protein|nr:hypothetical protein [Paracoccaceae bacterium]HBV54483.1 hypothetical protein [Paracoccaceae bacterium]